MIIDAFTFHNEIDMLDFRLRFLYDTVDFFVIVEADRTFQGQEKVSLLEGYMSRFEWARNKVILFKKTLDVRDLSFAQRPTSYDPGSSFFKLEYQQRNAIEEACASFDDRDLIMVSDVDEIPSLEAIDFAASLPREDLPLVCDQAFFYYNLRNLRSERWRGTMITSMRDMRSRSPQGLRDARSSTNHILNGGWHLSYFGHSDFISKKIESFSHQEFNSDTFTNRERISRYVDTGKDIFDRDVSMSLPSRSDFTDEFISTVLDFTDFMGAGGRLEFVEAEADHGSSDDLRNEESDKFFWHRYVDFYETYFSAMKNVGRILEFGIANGDSIRWLRHRFPDAEIVGIDILPIQPGWPQGEGIRYHRVDQGRREDIAAFFDTANSYFDLIIEDGSHIPQHQVSCLIESLKWMRPGGLYIIEDISTSHPENKDFQRWFFREGRCQPNALHVLLAIQHVKDLGIDLSVAQRAKLQSPEFFSADQIQYVFDTVESLSLYKRTSLPLKCWRCGSRSFDYVAWTCECGIDLLAAGDSMAYALKIKN